MAQVKVYGQADRLRPRRATVSAAIHRAVMEALEFPPEKRFHRFLYLEEGDYLFPACDGRTRDYTIVEIGLFEGRAPQTRKRLIRLLYEYLEADAGLAAANVEVILTQTPRSDWGLRGAPADELALGYSVEV